MEELNRDILLDYIQNLTVSELGDSVNRAVSGIAVIDISAKRIIFQDQMDSIIGPSAHHEMYMETYYQLIPDDQRKSIAIEYEEMTLALYSGDADMLTIRHSIRVSQTSERRDIEISFRAHAIGAQKYLVGIVHDITPNQAQKSYYQMMQGDIDAYLFTYDIVTDTLYLSSSFVADFDLPSGTFEKFTVNFAKYMYPEDAVKFNELFVQFLNTRESINGHVIRFLAPGRGDLYLKLGGISDSSSMGEAEDGRYVSGVLSDVTDDRVHNIEEQAIWEGSDCVRFSADVNRETVVFSDNVTGIFPIVRPVITGDFVEEMAQFILTKDRKRFRNAMHRAVNEPGSKFAVEFRVRQKGGRIIWVAVRGKSYFDPAKNSYVLAGMINNLTKLNEVKEIVEKKESSNETTGLPSRDKLMNDTARVIRDPQVLSCAVILIDISEFHSFNDNYGREAGNAILNSVAEFVADNLPDGAELYHIGVDTFAVLWMGASRKSVTSMLETLIARNNGPMITTEGDFFVNLSIAASLYPEGDTSEDLLGNAEIALHKTKSDKTLKYVIYSPADKLELSNRLDFVSQITSCINNKMENFQLYYQPLIDARTGMLAGAEALLRWQSNQGELVNPELVVAALEAADRMADVGRWIANEAIKQCAKWISKGAPRNFYIHINATADDLIRPDYAMEISELLRKYNLAPENILIELTETSLMENMGKCRKNLIELNNAGIRTALDDFGSGYSSFNYLKELPVDEIKIDKTFTDDMETVEFNASFIEAMTMLAHSINKSVVVEGVETESQVTRLRQMGADIFQGYYYGKPMSVFSFWNKYFG